MESDDCGPHADGARSTPRKTLKVDAAGEEGNGEVGDREEGSGVREEVDGAAPLMQLEAAPTRVGKSMEIQGCSEGCGLVLFCTICEWELCVVTAEDNTGKLDVKIFSDNTICPGVAPRYLRPFQ